MTTGHSSPTSRIRVLLPSGTSLGRAVRCVLETNGNELSEVPMTRRTVRASDPGIQVYAEDLQRGAFDWLMLTSKFGVSAISSWQIPAETRIGVVGPATATAVAALGRSVDCMPPQSHSAQALADEWARQVKRPAAQRVLIAQSARAQPTLANRLRALQATVTVAPIYTVESVPIAEDVLAALGQQHTHRNVSGNEATLPTIDVVVATSGSMLESLCLQLSNARRQHWPDTVPQPWTLIALGRQTAEAALALGLKVDATAAAATSDAVLAAIRQTHPRALTNSWSTL